VAYKVLNMSGSNRKQATEAAEIAFVYCTRCGKVIAHAPFGDLTNDEDRSTKLPEG